METNRNTHDEWARAAVARLIRRCVVLAAQELEAQSSALLLRAALLKRRRLG